MTQTSSQKATLSMRAASCLYGALLVFVAAPSQAALTLSNAPLFLTVSVPPNLVLTLDDSGSMRRAYVPELPASSCPNDPSDCSVLDQRKWKSARKNGLYYNPDVIYPAGKKADGTSWSTSFTAAYKDGFDPAAGTVNLETSYRPTAFYNFNNNAVSEEFMGHDSSDMACRLDDSSRRFCHIADGKGDLMATSTSCDLRFSTSTQRDNFCRGTQGSNYDPSPAPAYYYVFKPGNTNCSGSIEDDDCYSIVLVSTTSGPGTKDLNGDGAINAADKDERQNFANWYSFARTRNLAVKTATSISFSSLPSTTRVAWQALNTCTSSSLVDTDCDGYKNNFNGVSNAINSFTGLHRSNFYNWLYQLPTNSGTPLPQAMKRVGDYYRTSGENSPYDNDLSASNSGELSCRRNYHVMFTDGIWTTAASVGNADNTNTALPTSVNSVSEYTRKAPYRDGTSNTLADVAFKYWVEDARNTLDNNLTPSFKDRSGNAVAQFDNPRNDPAVWQHMVNFTIGLGLTPYLANAGLTWGGDMYSGSYSDLLSGNTPWPAASTTLNNPANVADLWHAAINSRGQFFSADDPASLASAFQSSLNAIAAGSGSNAALASNSTSLNLNNTVVYQAKFNQDWSGTLLALPVSIDGTVGDALWDASKLLPAAASRRILTVNNSTQTGVLFNSCDNLSDSQRTALNTNLNGTNDGLCSERMNWLRGDTSRETRNGGPFRSRTNGVMGDILSSNPAYVKNIDYGYSSMPGYADYVSGNANRTAMVYVGANDGKLYGIDALTGVEKFSFIPGSVYANLSALTDPNYLHKYYVDGAITVGDAYLNGSWKTMLLGGLNAGGKSIYALDITNPESFQTAAGAANVKWEFTDADMGYSFSQPQIGVLENGQWVAVFGNGYNSASGGAYLYIVDLATGTVEKKITASDITDPDPSRSDESNGLSTPALYDSDGDRRIDTIYAGDLNGNMWKFDVSGSSASWDVAFDGTPLFQARNALGGVQPITAQPTVLPHPQPEAALVVFGTGRYLTESDLSDPTVQSVYGLRDAGSAITGRDQLQEQRFDAEGTLATRKVRTVTNNSVDYSTKMGYYLDLVTATVVGERVTSPLPVKRGRIIITSIVPNVDPCTPGGTSYLTETSVIGGGALAYCAIDIDGNLKVDADDQLGGRCASSVELPVGLSTTALYLTSSDDVDGDGRVDSTGAPAPPDMKFHTGTNGTIIGTAQGNPTPPPPVGEVKRRSWIQIR